MPIAARRRLTAGRARLHLPRTVRMRLTLLCGGVVLLSGGALVAVAFGLGTHTTQQTFFVGRASSGGLGPSGAVLPLGPLGVAGAGGRVTAQPGSGGLTIDQVSHSAQQFGSNAELHNLFIFSLVALGVVTGAGLALGWALSGRMLRPLRTIRTKTQHISEENLHERLALPGPRGDELKDLGDTIDELLGRLEAAFEAQRRFVQNAAHELRTPITMMRTSLDVATGKPGGAPPEVSALAGKLGEGIEQAERLLEGFLALARVQAGALGDRAPLELSAVVGAALAVRAGEIESLGLTVERELGDSVAMGSETLVPQIARNLVDNAIRHNEPGGWMRVTTESDGGVARLVVENGGARVDQARVDELGQPFHRLVDRTASDRGAGLGLSIVSAIVRAEGGTMTLQAREGGGLRVTVELRSTAQSVPAGSR